MLAVVDMSWSEDLKDLPYTIASMTTLEGVGYLHAEVLDYERAKRELAGRERVSSPAISPQPSGRAFTR